MYRSLLHLFECSLKRRAVRLVAVTSCIVIVAGDTTAQDRAGDNGQVIPALLGRVEKAFVRTPIDMEVHIEPAETNNPRRIVDRPDPTISREEDRAAKAAANDAALRFRQHIIKPMEPSPTQAASRNTTTSDTSNTTIGQLNFEATGQDESGGWVPSDAHGAVGPDHYVETTNSHISVYEKTPQADGSANRLISRTLNDFFGYTGPSLVDPRVVYDWVGNRFIIVATALGQSPTVQMLYIGVSQTGDATGGYWIYSINTNESPVGVPGDFWDFPIIGMDHNSIFITGNIVGSGDTRLICFPKSTIYNGNGTTFAVFKGLRGTLAPPIVESSDLNPKSYFLVPDYYGGIKKYTLTNSSNPSTAVLAGPVDVSGVPAFSYPPDASQPGTPFLLDTLDIRFRNASAQVGDNIWQVHNVYSLGRSVCSYYRIRPSTNQVIQTGTFNASSTSDDFNPSIAVDANQTAYVCWSSTDPPNGLNAQTRVATKGTAASDIGAGVSAYGSPTYYTWFPGWGNVARWGDVSAITLDGSRAWAVNNSIVNPTHWGSHVVAFDAPRLVADSTQRSETESLPITLVTPPPSGISRYQWYGSFSSPSASAGAGTYFNANAIGQQIAYTLSVQEPGTYRINVGIQTKPDKGKFQLSVDGVKRGLVQDEYSLTAGYTTRDLGTVTFQTAGDKTFNFTVVGRNAASTGYTLAFDYIDLISTSTMEAESLDVVARSTAPAGVFSSALASGGGGYYFNATAVGQYITYAVPIIRPGTYHIMLGVQTKPEKGICQLKIDGQNQGSQQDEYTATVGYDARDLGTVTFTSAGIKNFTFTVMGRNLSSTGYTLAFDYIDVSFVGPAPIQRLETESLRVQSMTPPPVGISPFQWSGIFSNPNASGLAGTYFNATAVGNYVTYTVPGIDAGLYKVRVGIQTKPNKGKFQLTINGSNQGQVQDEYSSTVTYSARDLGTVYLASGDQQFKLTVIGKNASSAGYTLAFDYIELVPTDRAETESLKVQSITPKPTGYASAQWLGIFNDANASGGSGTYFNAIATGDYITYAVPVGRAGTYRVKVGIHMKPNKGMFQLAVNGINQGQIQDEYASTIQYSVRDLGPVYLNAGAQPFTFTVVGKNLASGGFTLAFDYIELVPP